MPDIDHVIMVLGIYHVIIYTSLFVCIVCIVYNQIRLCLDGPTTDNAIYHYKLSQ